ncbi:hypothetical protein FDUTEX481_00874 [Tolypothrix sp. PCC 7601]|nr:hypothetical protein FDUTEX481_00874 [Tolypothrix sp. PCC 7601]
MKKSGICAAVSAGVGCVVAQRNAPPTIQKLRKGGKGERFSLLPFPFNLFPFPTSCKRFNARNPSALSCIKYRIRENSVFQRN